MSTLTATAKPDTASVLLIIDRTQKIRSITRTDDSGTWPVRLKEHQINGSTGKLLVSDYEARHGNNSYKVITTGQTLTKSVTLTLTSPWIMVPRNAFYSIQPEQITDYQSTRESLGSIFQVIGAATPLAVQGPLGTRNGTIDFPTRSYADARKLEQALGRKEVCLLKGAVGGMDMYFIAQAIDVSPIEPANVATAYRVSVRFLEVDMPVGHQFGSMAWNLEAVKSKYSSLGSILTAHATLDAFTMWGL